MTHFLMAPPEYFTEAHIWLTWLARRAGCRTVAEFLTTAALAMCGVWAVAAMGMGEAFFANLDRRNSYLLHEAKWERRWWHYPSFPRFWVWQLLSFVLPIAIFFEIWWRCTKWHGRRLVRMHAKRRRSNAVSDAAVVPNQSATWAYPPPPDDDRFSHG